VWLSATATELLVPTPTVTPLSVQAKLGV